MYTLGKRKNDFEIVSLSPVERTRHLYISGSTGTGKSNLLKNLIYHDLQEGRGLILIDPHGDLSKEIADVIPPERIEDTIYFDPMNPEWVIGFNPLKRTDKLHRSATAAKIVSVFRLIWKDFWGPRVDYVAMNAVSLLLSTHSTTLLDIPPLLVDEKYRQKLLSKCDDNGIKFFWTEEFAKLEKKRKEEWIGPLQNKAGQFRTNAILRAVVGQRKGIDIEEIINTKKILICNFSKAMGDEPARLLGAFITIALSQASDARALIPQHERQGVSAYIDEFQNYATDVFATMFSEARKMQLSLVTANQFLSQLPELVQDAVFGNVGTFVVFRVGVKDARDLSDQLGIPNRRALLDLPNYEAFARLMRGDEPVEPAIIKTDRFSAPGGSLAAVLARVQRHARSRTTVEAEIKERLRRPELPPEEW